MDVVAHLLQPERRDPQQPFHAFSEDELFSLPGSIPGRLTSGQAQAGLARYGYNDSSRIQKSPVIFQFLDHFKNLLVMILLMDGQGFPA
jgi:magnesium-transporting ATPase (P-type)